MHTDFLPHTVHNQNWESFVIIIVVNNDHHVRKRGESLADVEIRLVSGNHTDAHTRHKRDRTDHPRRVQRAGESALHIGELTRLEPAVRDTRAGTTPSAASAVPAVVD